MSRYIIYYVVGPKAARVHSVKTDTTKVVVVVEIYQITRLLEEKKKRVVVVVPEDALLLVSVHKAKRRIF